jgi:hydrogenase expression/formation protein HypC
VCLAVPVRIVQIEGDSAVVELDGVRRKTNVSLIRDAAVGDHVLLHAGFAIQKWSDEDVAEYNAIMKEMQGVGM